MQHVAAIASRSPGRGFHALDSSVLRILSAATIAVACAAASSARADDVYRWTDSSGIVHYSTKSEAKKQGEKAELPEIMRGEMKLTTQKLVTCQEHGGINCQAGSDGDGSVICYDGFKDATNRYRFSCNSPKLEITDVSDLSPNGGFTVFVRNSKGVEAASPAVLFKPGNGKETKLKGPEKIEPFGIGEFAYESGGGEALATKPTIAELNVTCSNCPS